MEHQIRNRQVQKEYVCRVEGEFPRYDTLTLWCYDKLYEYYVTFQVYIIPNTDSNHVGVFPCSLSPLNKFHNIVF
jgi:hypothetical protein